MYYYIMATMHTESPSSYTSYHCVCVHAQKYLEQWLLQYTPALVAFHSKTDGMARLDKLVRYKLQSKSADYFNKKNYDFSIRVH